jgi:cytochrome c-type biogenesis protein CcsB
MVANLLQKVGNKMIFEDLLWISSNFLLVSFILLLLAIIPLGLAIKTKRSFIGKFGMVIVYLAFILQIIHFLLRWMAVGHAPVSNMYEFMTFFGIMLNGAFLMIHFLYKQTIIGLFSIPTVLLIIGYGSVFSNEVSPLLPSLQSNWLAIHVITVAASSAILSIAFVTGVMYLLRTVDVTKKSISNICLEVVFYCLIVVLGFVISSVSFNFIYKPVTVQFKDVEEVPQNITYTMPAIVVNELAVNNTSFGLVEIPSTIHAKKLNSIIWALIVGTILYIFLRIGTRKLVIQLLKPFTQRINPILLDEIAYRSVLIGFPLFSLGGLFFAMIWAQLAWGRYWGWDPKEVWALITWLFYAALLHLRLSKGWEGERTAWLSIIGFGLIVFNQVFVNLVIAGLHSYA